MTVLMSDAQTIEAVRFILNSGEAGVIEALKSNVYSYTECVRVFKENRKQEAQKKRDSMRVINGGMDRAAE